MPDEKVLNEAVSFEGFYVVNVVKKKSKPNRDRSIKDNNVSTSNRFSTSIEKEAVIKFSFLHLSLIHI